MSSAPSGNLFAEIVGRLDAEEIAPLLTMPELRIERIVSTGQASQPGHWYDQDWAEWVIVLRGSARLLFADEREPRLLGPGDYVLIPPHRRHRVEMDDAGRAHAVARRPFPPGLMPKPGIDPKRAVIACRFRRSRGPGQIP